MSVALFESINDYRSGVGTSVTISGTGFLTGATVKIGGVTCTSPSVTPMTSMTCTSGAHALGVVDVVVTNTDSQTGTISSGFTYQPAAVTSWVFVEGNTNTGINKDSSNQGIGPQLADFNSKLYSTWVENGTTRVSVYNGNDSSPGWSFVDGNNAGGLTQSGTNDVMSNSAQLLSFNSKLYLAYSDTVIPKVRIQVYNGNDSSPTWTNVSGVNGINHNPGYDGTSPQLTVFNSKLYATWEEIAGSGPLKKQTRVSVYNGNDSSPSWSFVDGNTTTGTNYSTVQDARNPFLVAFNSKLYSIWWESTATFQQVRVKVYNGNDSSPSWAFVDGNTATGINHNTGISATFSHIVNCNSKLYAIFSEPLVGITQMRVQRYNGNDSSPSWVSADGNGATGINYDTAKMAYYPRLTCYFSMLYATWEEVAGVMGQTRVKVYNGNDIAPSWSAAEPGGVNGINKDTSRLAEFPNLTVFNSKLYSAWQEAGASPNNIRIAVGQ